MSADYKDLLGYIGAISIIVSIVTIVLIPMFLTLIPKDYFLSPKRPALPFKTNHPLVNGAVMIVKNILGAFLILVGILLLALPGQGILTIVVGFILLDLPGKRVVELNLVKHRGVLAALNWVRRKVGREPFVVS